MLNFDPTLVLTLAVGFAWLFMFGQWFDFIGQYVSIKPDLLPADLKLADRSSVLGAVSNLTGRSLPATRVRSLLSAWSLGASNSDLVELAANQSSRITARARAALYFSVLVMASALLNEELASMAATGLGVAGATYFLAMVVLNRMDDFIESNLLTKLPGPIEGTSLTADALAESLGGAIDKAFRNYVPQPEKLAAALSSALEGAMKMAASNFEMASKTTTTALDTSGKNAAAALDTAVKAAATNVEALYKKMSESQDALAVKWSGQQKETVASLETAKKALDAVTAQLTSGLSGSAEKWQGSLAAHATQVTQANQALATQLEKIQALGKEIEKVLHVQLAVDNTIKSVTTTEEFKNTLMALKKHLELSDNLIREVTKPRTIRLVENEVV